MSSLFCGTHIAGDIACDITVGDTAADVGGCGCDWTEGEISILDVTPSSFRPSLRELF